MSGRGTLVFQLGKKSGTANAVTVSIGSRNKFEYVFADNTGDFLAQEKT